MVNDDLVIIPYLFPSFVTELFLLLYDFYQSQAVYYLFDNRFSVQNCEIIALCLFCIVINCLPLNFNEK